ncbi:hypothetical protein AAC387_Pa05g0368 [Persea americana]
MDLDVRNCERQRSKQDVDLVSEKDKVGVDKEENEESNSLLSPRGSGMVERERSSRRKVQWNDKNGNKLFEVLEFQPSDSSDSDSDDGVDTCICAIM